MSLVAMIKKKEKKIIKFKNKKRGKNAKKIKIDLGFLKFMHMISGSKNEPPGTL
jgi:hypothetical protein